MSDKDNYSNAEVAPVESPSVSLPLRSMGSEAARSAEAESPTTEAEERGTIKDERADDDERTFDGAQPNDNANLSSQAEALQAMVQSLVVTVRTQDREVITHL